MLRLRRAKNRRGEEFNASGSSSGGRFGWRRGEVGRVQAFVSLQFLMVCVDAEGCFVVCLRDEDFRVSEDT